MQRLKFTLQNSAGKVNAEKSRAVALLVDQGAHFVLCREDKRPLWKAWQHASPSIAVSAGHAGPLGIIPASIKTLGLDIDAGNPAAFIESHPPIVALQSKRPGGLHAYFDDEERRGNGRFDLGGVSGEIRSARGYLILHHDGIFGLADAIRKHEPGSCPFPSDLFVAAGIEIDTSRPLEDVPAGILAEVQHDMLLEEIAEGARNVALFDAVRFWAYGARPNGTIAARDLTFWYESVESIAFGYSGRFCSPLPAAEVRATAYSVASWVASGYREKGHTSAAQRRRVVKRWKGDAKPATLRALKDRDKLIIEAVAGGASIRSTAARFDLQPWGIRYILRRDAPLLLKR